MFEIFRNNYISSQNGATAIEYALIVGGIAVAISVVVFAFGADVTALFEDTGELFKERPE
jgi:pilus assembly protein Flp/PilA